jgi:hypothetical protein
VRQRDAADGLVVPAVLRKSRGLPRADRPSARDQERGAGAEAAALVQKAVEDVDLGPGLIERAHRGGGEEPLGRARRLLPRRAQELARHDALQVLVEAFEEAEPSPVCLQTQPVELLPQGGEPLRETSFDFRFEETESILRLGIGHEFHYRGSRARRKAFWYQRSAPDRTARAPSVNPMDPGLRPSAALRAACGRKLLWSLKIPQGALTPRQAAI